jgi:DNA-binding transcriptional LysR family regulator
MGVHPGSRIYMQRVIHPLRLRLLVEVDRLGSITHAAAACSMGQSTASTHLHTLEAALGHRLTERVGRATRLTDAGRLLARHAATVLSTLDGLEEELAALDGAITGTLFIASCDAFGNYVLPGMLGAFAAERPGAEIRVRIASSGEVARAVACGDANLGIAGQTAGTTDGVVAEPLLRDELVWIAPSRVDAVPRVMSGLDIEGRVLIVPGRESGTGSIVDRILDRLGHRPARRLELESLEAVKRAVRAEVGIALVSRLAVADELAAGQLRVIELPGEESVAGTIEILRREHHDLTPLEQVFEHVLRLRCARLGGLERRAGTDDG